MNRYSNLELTADSLIVHYVLDIAEIPTFQMWPDIDLDGDEIISQDEEIAYLQAQAISVKENLDLLINGRPAQLTLQEQHIAFPEGQGQLPTTRIELTYITPLNGDETVAVDFKDFNYADRLGWQEIVVSPTAANLLEGNYSTQDVSQALTSYPQDLLANPLTVDEAVFTFEVSETPAAAPVNEATAAVGSADTDRFSSERLSELISQTDSSPLILLVAFLTAFALGAAHALSPGHGKTIVGAYLVGSEGTAKQAIFLGLTTTIAHTSGVLLFGLVVLLASRYILPEVLYPWLGVISGLLVVIIGLSMLWGRWHQYQASKNPSAQFGMHSHFGIAHSHVPQPNQGQANGRVSWRRLLTLGVSGGLIPCPSALVLLLSAIALQRVAFGLVLILIFSIGLASVLTGIGLLCVYATRLFQRFPAGHGRLAVALPVLSALFITLAGAGITWQAFGQIGLL